MPEHDPNRVLIFDTTLRDGEQSPGCTMTPPEKLRVARALADLGVDIIEAGFPAASRGDWESVQSIAREIEGPVIAGLARCNSADIDRAWSAIRDARRPRLHLFLATSAIHRQYKLNMAREEIIHAAAEGVRHARSLCADVEFSPEDASRTELEFLAEVVEAAVAAGATTINIPDTVGYAVPEEYFETFQYLKKHVSSIGKVVLSAHCHDDLGMAVANSLAAVRAGARQVECTINGIGERAGNCSLEELVMALRTREGFFGLTTGIDTRRLYPASRLLSSITGMPIPRNKAVVGENAFAHESGIHQHGMLRHHSTYEIMRPEDVGLTHSNLVLGKHSGRHAFRERVRELGFELDDSELNRVFDDFKALADKKKELFDGDIEALVLRIGNEAGDGPWQLARLHVESDSAAAGSARVVLGHADGRQVEVTATGDGPVDAAFKAVENATGVDVKLRKFEVRSVSVGEDAQGEAVVTVEYRGRSYRGTSVTTDIVESAVRAFLIVVNQIEATRHSVAVPGASSGSRPPGRSRSDDRARVNTLPRTLFDKVWDRHVVVPETADSPAVLYVDLHLVHEVTSPQAFDVLRARGLRLRRPDRTLATMDHSTPTDPAQVAGRVPIAVESAARQVRQLTRNCQEFGLELLGMGDDRRGIVHIIGPELGLTQPGRTIVCGDSHTSTHGAFGALAFGIGTTEVGHVFATQCLLQRRPRTMAVDVTGRLGPGITAKDLALAIIGRVGVNGGTGHVIEYLGSGVEALSMDERMTICNMSIEAGARAGMVAPDDTTLEYLRGRPRAPAGDSWERAVADWRTLRTDPDATFDRRVSHAADVVEPMITYGTHPGMVVPIGGCVPDRPGDAVHAKSLAYMGLQPGERLRDKAIQAVFIGSCTNARLSDLELAAKVFAGRRVAPGVRVLIVPGSQSVKREAEARGIAKVFLDAGAEWRESGCSMCLGMNGDTVESGKYCVSTSNRNFEGRQGKGARTLLASPAAAAAAAVRGRITDPREFLH